MFKKLLSCVREYKRPTIITLVLIIFEAVIETFIPFITADLINKSGTDINQFPHGEFDDLKSYIENCAI